MPHPKDDEVYSVETVVRILKTNEFAIVKDHTFVKDNRGFLNYLCIIEDRSEGLYALYHDDIELEA